MTFESSLPESTQENEGPKDRILARQLARELTLEELEDVSGAGTCTICCDTDGCYYDAFLG
jgi:hypothetical protein